MPERKRQSKGRPPHRHAVAPRPLARPPRTDLEVSVAELDERIASAARAVVDRLEKHIDGAMSIDTIRMARTRADMLLAMLATHRSIRQLVAGDAEEIERSVDGFPLVRVQLERCFLALLLADHPDRWLKRYRKNAWKTLAERYYRDQRMVGLLPGFEEYFGPSGQGIRMLREYAREMDVWEDELQTVRTQLTGARLDRRWSERFIADMPTPARALGLLEDEGRRNLGELLYPYYSNLSHFSHGGLAGVMESAVLRDRGEQGRDFWRGQVVQEILPLSYVSVMIVSTLFAEGMMNDDLRQNLLHGWRPYVSDGSTAGVAVWDSWAADTLST